MEEKNSPAIPLTSNQLLLQGTRLRNSDHVYAMAVYTGNQTRLGQNKHVPPTKWTKIDRLVNYITVLIFLFQLIAVLVLGVTGDVVNDEFGSRAWYLVMTAATGEITTGFFGPLVIPLRFLLLCSLMIPISLKVTLDCVKLMYALFINWDLHLYHEPTDTPAQALNTSISEDLGQVQVIFTDKTGTLTENQMIFKKCSAGGRSFSNMDPAGSLDDPALTRAVDAQQEEVFQFMRVLLVCNSVSPITA